MWIWYRCQNRIENYYHHDGEQLGFYKKVHIKTGQKEGCSCNLYNGKKRMCFNLFDKNCTQKNAQLYIPHGESWLGGIAIEWANHKQVTHLYFLKEIVALFK